MMAVETNLSSTDLPDSLAGVRSAIEAAVPHGRTDNGGANDRGAWHMAPIEVLSIFRGMSRELHDICDGSSAILDRASNRAHLHLGTLGTGNHFIEVCLDERERVWVMLHSGSRGIGNAIGRHFIEKAKADMRRWFVNLPDADLAYIPEGSENFAPYMRAVSWAQGFAYANRALMMAATLRAIATALNRPDFKATDKATNCHHNYVAQENHFGANVYVTRKGAVRAREGDLGIIPGSMGARSFIVEGKGNPESFCSCSHGAGRRMSRGEARRTITLEDHAAATAGVECRKDEDVLDESPAAYKNVEAVMAAQASLVSIKHTLSQVVCVKG
jgi:tRNA-splicing ligase RtcB